MKARKIIAALGAVASLVAATTFGTQSAEAASKITIAGVYGMTYDPFWISLGCGAKKQAKSMGVTWKDYSTKSGDAADYSNSFTSATLSKPNGIFVNPANPNQFITQYKQQMSKGVPVVTINGTTPAAQYKVVGTDVANTAFLTELGKVVAAGTKGSIGIVNGVPGLAPVDNRLNPVVDAIKRANPGLKELETQYTYFDSNKAQQAASALMLANADLKVLVAADGPDGEGVAAAVKAAGKAGQIVVISLDATPPLVAALKDGTISALVAQAPARIGALQVKSLVDYIKSGKKGAVKASSDFVGVPQKLLLASNVDNKANADWVYKATC